jgi:hypothetical protein
VALSSSPLSDSDSELDSTTIEGRDLLGVPARERVYTCVWMTCLRGSFRYRARGYGRRRGLISVFDFAVDITRWSMQFRKCEGNYRPSLSLVSGGSPDLEVFIIRRYVCRYTLRPMRQSILSVRARYRLHN